MSRDSGVAPTLQGSAFVRYGSKEVGATVIGVVPEQERRVTKIEEDMIEGTLDDLKTASNGLILGNGLAKKLDVKVNDLVTVVSAKGVILKMKVVGLFRTGIVQIDDAQAYALLKKVQILEKRINVINQIRIRLAEVNRARGNRRPYRGALRLQGGELAGSQRSDLRRLRRAERNHVHDHGRHSAGRLLRHLQCHLDGHLREIPGHRDPEVDRLHPGGRTAHLPARRVGRRRGGQRRRLGVGRLPAVPARPLGSSRPPAPSKSPGSR